MQKAAQKGYEKIINKAYKIIKILMKAIAFYA